MNLFGKLFQKKNNELTDQEPDLFYNAKDKSLEEVLGQSTLKVGHAIIPFEAGGAVDMYYYHHPTKGTIFATQELINLTGQNPIENRLGFYELVALTKHKYNDGEIGKGKFGQIERRTCSIFTRIGNYAFETKLEPGDTCELPVNDGPNQCLIFDEYIGRKDFEIQGKKYGLLLVIEIHKDEMEFAIEHGSSKLFALLKEKGHYPYSDLDRESVIKV